MPPSGCAYCQLPMSNARKPTTSTCLTCRRGGRWTVECLRRQALQLRRAQAVGLDGHGALRNAFTLDGDLDLAPSGSSRHPGLEHLDRGGHGAGAAERHDDVADLCGAAGVTGRGRLLRLVGQLAAQQALQLSEVGAPAVVVLAAPLVGVRPDVQDQTL